VLIAFKIHTWIMYKSKNSLFQIVKTHLKLSLTLLFHLWPILCRIITDYHRNWLRQACTQHPIVLNLITTQVCYLDSHHPREEVGNTRLEGPKMTCQGF
jgi:hypothetical protein